MNKNNVNINTVGDLKRALEEYNDDTIINSGSKQLDINSLVGLLDSNVYERVAIREIENEMENIAYDNYNKNSHIVSLLTTKDIQIMAQELEESSEFSNAMSEVSEIAELIMSKYLNSKIQKPIKEILPEDGLSRLKEMILQDEIDCTMDEQWTFKNESNEAIQFLAMTDEEKREYAKDHANKYMEELISEDIESFYKMVGNAYECIDSVKELLNAICF